MVGNPSCDNRLARKSAPRFDSTNTSVLSVPEIWKQPRVGDKQSFGTFRVYFITSKGNLPNTERRMCSSRKYPYPPHGRPMEIPEGVGVLKAKLLKGMYKAWNFQRGGGIQTKKPSVGGVWIFSGTQCQI